MGWLRSRFLQKDSRNPRNSKGFWGFLLGVVKIQHQPQESGGLLLTRTQIYVPITILLQFFNNSDSVEVWCNGSTTDFDSVSLGSSPSISSKQKYITGPVYVQVTAKSQTSQCVVYSCLGQNIGATMDEKQKLLAEILKLKMYFVRKLSSHTFKVETQDVLDKINEAIDKIEKM